MSISISFSSSIILEPTPDGQSLESLKLHEPLLLPALPVSSLSLGVHPFGHVTGGGEHAEHVAASVAIDRGVVENLSGRPIVVGHRQRVAPCHPVGDPPPVDLVGQTDRSSKL